MCVSRLRTILLLGLLGVVSPLASKAAPFNPDVLSSVVSLLPDQTVQGSGGAQQTTPGPEGTAVAIYPGGYLATNAHVVRRATHVSARLNDGRFFSAEIIGIDLATDLALLRVPVDLPPLPAAHVSTVGSPVCAVGNQFGLGLSVTCGVVSALARTDTGFNPIEDFIQTDAAINPGGSGGALVNEAGQLIGLASAIYTKKNDANIGVNFATSSAMLLRILDDLRDHGYVLRIHSGLLVRSLLESQRKIYVGARVVRVETGSPAARAKFQTGDILTRIGERSIKRPADVGTAFQFLRPGDTVQVQLIRSGARQVLRFTAD